MNYFTLFEIPVSLKIDQGLLLRKYYSLCKKYHPDNFTLSELEEQVESEKMTAAINMAKKVLSDEYSRLEYILQEHQIIEADEKYQLPPAFLSEIMDLNEQLIELEMEKDEQKTALLKQQIIEMEHELFDEVKYLYDQDALCLNAEEASILKAYYYKKKYLQRIMKRLI